jgi:hypothetical protein
MGMEPPSEAGGHWALGLRASQCTGGTLEGWLRNLDDPNWGGTSAMGIGFALTALLMLLKLRLPLLPLHPLAFPFSFNWTIDMAMPAIIATWLVKSLLLRYGGLPAHRRALPLFLGLIVGSAVMTLVQSLIAPWASPW